MKKLIALCMAVMVIFAFTACTQKQVDEKGSITVVVMQETPLVYELELDNLDLSEGGLSIVKYLNQEKGLTLVYENSNYGAYITQIGDLKTDDAGFVSVFTSVEAEWDQTAYCVTKDYNGVTVKSAAVGISSLSIIDGMVLYFAYIAY